MRLLILLGLVYLLFRSLKKWIEARPTAPGLGQGAGPVADVMVQDPQCGIYFPKRDGFPLRHEGRTLLFCSAECREKFSDAQN